MLNQIQACLKLPKLWRFVGFASSVVGLISYALSSSFNSLFGKWTLWKTFLYSIFSFIISTTILFAKTYQLSISTQFKAHMAFLVLAITSFYSSFFDEQAKGKPDTYSLVSSVAFAVMSLNLSKQTHCGIEVDLLYFFLGTLIIQLTKIKWLLGIVGAGFSYSMIILRSNLDSLPESNRITELQDQSQVIIDVNSSQSQNDVSSDSTQVFTTQEGNTQDHEIIGDGGQSGVIVNGKALSDRVIKEAEKLAGPIHPGNYWYDSRAGFWGVIGGPCLGIIPPSIAEFNYPMPDKCAGGNTGVYVNGRELHQRDLDLLSGRGLPRDTNRSYIIDISGRVLDGETGEQLDSLGKLAPTMERAGHGFGMKVPRA